MNTPIIVAKVVAIDKLAIIFQCRHGMDSADYVTVHSRYANQVFVEIGKIYDEWSWWKNGAGVHLTLGDYVKLTIL